MSRPPNPPPLLLTVGRMAELLGVPLHCVTYQVRARRIHPVNKAGRLRVFDEKAMEHLHRILVEEGEIHVARH